ncbi:hypothetical protein [Pseudoalteromonas piscicida]|nr:hypothetical protein [Pseudoalteromonas piscicida]
MDKLEQTILASIASNEQESISDSCYEYKSLFISKVTPDHSNPRYFPAVIMSDEHAYQVATKQLSKKQLIERYSAENKVVIGKSCIVNCCVVGSTEWKKSNQTIASIIELGENVAVSEVIQAPTVFPTEDGSYQILTGHRRFFAMIYAHGVNGAAHFKVYDKKPVLHKIKQFQENASREDLPQYGKLRAFMTAMHEIEALNKARKRVGGKALTVKETVSVLGISGGAFDNYNVLVRYPAVVTAYEDGNSLSFVKMKKLVLTEEKNYQTERGLTVLTGSHKREINSLLAEKLSGKAAIPAGNKKRNELYTFEKVESPKVIKKLLSCNIMSLDSGVDWDSIDWGDTNMVNSALRKVISFLSESES